MTRSHSVAVIGLGAMGTALAEAFLAAGHSVAVWNRTASRADPLRRRGATVVQDAAAAVAAAPLVVVCLLDTAAVDAVIDAASDALADASIVNLTSSTPEDARTTAVRVRDHGARYLDGTMMVPTPLVGTAEAFVLYSGDETVLADHRETLVAISGEIDMLGPDPGLAAVYDLAMLDVFFSGMAAFLHATAMVESDGVSPKDFLPYAHRMLDVLRFSNTQLAEEVERGEHPGDEDNLDMELAFLDHIVATSRTRGIDTSIPETSRQLVRAAISAGHGQDGFSRVMDVLRRRR
jgi:3-hydroxyisobutyrate dehydrogenase-like beta-hydroxyacid dehydrogenase